MCRASVHWKSVIGLSFIMQMINTALICEHSDNIFVSKVLRILWWFWSWSWSWWFRIDVVEPVRKYLPEARWDDEKANPRKRGQAIHITWINIIVIILYHHHLNDHYLSQYWGHHHHYHHYHKRVRLRSLRLPQLKTAGGGRRGEDVCFYQI